MTKQLAVLNRRSNGRLANHPERIIQFGTGNFLKGFIDWIVQQLNEKAGLDAGIVAVKLRAGNEAQIDAINVQDGLFTINIRGIEQGKLVDSYSLIDAQNRALSPYQDMAAFLALAESPTMEWVISNTTEAGIRFSDADRLDDTPPETFPAKLTLLLYRRFGYFQGDAGKGWKILCCELIENNATVLAEIIKRYANLWQLEEEFIQWLDQSCRFYNTLVDRIVTGPPATEVRRLQVFQQLGYIDNELIESESYYQWVIQGDDHLRQHIPDSAGLNIIITDDLLLYRQRKVRILNGAHTASVALARLLDIAIVYQGMQHELLSNFMRRVVYSEICPTIAMPADELKTYADSILERFENPFLYHEWTSIGLNSLSKWQARILPALRDSMANTGTVPTAMSLSLAAIILLYRGEYQDRTFELKDNVEHVALIASAWRDQADTAAVVRQVLAAAEIWAADLNDCVGLAETVTGQLDSMLDDGVVATLERMLKA